MTTPTNIKSLNKHNLYMTLYVLGGSFDESQTAVGQIAGFNMWQREMSAEELLTETCGSEGTVASIDNFSEKGTLERSITTFPECAGNNSYIYKFICN